MTVKVIIIGAPSVGRILGRLASVAVSLSLGVLVSMYMIGGWERQADLEAYNKRRRGE